MLYRRFARGFVAVCIGFVLVGCAQPLQQPLPIYLAPAGTHTARLLMRGYIPAGDTYGVFVFGNAETCMEPQKAGAGNATHNPDATRLRAGELSTVSTALYKPDRSVCAIRWSFVPQAGRSYVITMSAREGGCASRLLDVTDPDRPVPEPTLRRRNSAENICIPMSQTRALTTATDNDTAKQKPSTPQGNAPAADDDLQNLSRP